MGKRPNGANHGRGAVSIQDVAEAAGVSIATVSRVLNSPQMVSAKTGDRVRAVIAELGYVPNPFAQGLITRASRVLGFALPDIHGEFYSVLLQGADAKARELGYHLLVSAETRAGAGGHGQRALGFGLIDGLALMITEPNASIWQEARSTGLPVVLMDTESPEADVDCILVDNDSGTREAVLHLLDGTPGTRLHFVGGPQTNFDTIKRAECFRRTLREAGHTVEDANITFGDYSVERGRRWVQDHASDLRGTAILAGNDEIALGILQGVQDLNLSMPGDVRLVGFDDTRLATIVRPSLSSVRVPMFEVGSASIEALASRVEDPEMARRVYRLPTSLVVRASSAL